MSSKVDWRLYVNEEGDFEFPRYLFNLIMGLMKNSLDFGTLLSNDPAKLRAYKEQTKSVFKKRWLEVAQALEAFDIIIPCGCPISQYCSKCGGSRYRMADALSPDRMREISMVLAPGQDSAIARKLEAGLEKAIHEVERIR